MLIGVVPQILISKSKMVNYFVANLLNLKLGIQAMDLFISSGKKKVLILAKTFYLKPKM